MILHFAMGSSSQLVVSRGDQFPDRIAHPLDIPAAPVRNVPRPHTLLTASISDIRGVVPIRKVPKGVLAAGNSHHVTEACYPLCCTLLDSDRMNRRCRRKIRYSACRLQPPERPTSALFCAAGTAGAAMVGKRSKRLPTAETASSSRARTATRWSRATS